MTANADIVGGKARKVEIVWMKPQDLIPYGNNPRKNDKAVDSVAASIRSFGFNVPITVDENLVVATGHTRLKAALRLGLTSVPVIILRGLTTNQINAWRLADNKTGEQATWDEDKLQIELRAITGLDLGEFGFRLDSSTDNLKEDDFEAILPGKPKSKLGDVFQLGGSRVICGDATDANTYARLMAGELADLVMTDPPYNVDYEGEAGKIMNDSMDPEKWSGFMSASMRLLAANLKQGGSAYVWNPSHIAPLAMAEAGIRVRQTLIWNKNQFTMGRQDYQWKHEPCLYGWKEGAPHYFVNDRGYSTVLEDKAKDVSEMKASELRKLVKDLMRDQKVPLTVIDEDKPLKDAEHPTMKPIRLIGRLIANSSRKGEMVLDPFAGSGSTLIACEELGRRCYSVELDPKFVDVIIDRWEKFTGRKAQKL